MLQIGDQLDNYQIQGHLAQGGMSDIYRAYDLINRRDVVLKIPEPGLIGDPAQYERFQRELDVINKLRHPVIVVGLGSGQYNRIPYLVTEYVDGISMRKLIETSAPMDPVRAVDLVKKIADGMAYCHANEVIHRDLKPENILITPDDQPVLIDFGLALTKGSHRITYANLTAAAGTPDYMAPEQIDGQRGDARTDIYALGTILFELLAGRTPFQGDTNLAVMAQHMRGKLPRLDILQSGVPASIAAVVARALQRDPSSRYQTMRELILALENPESVDLSWLTKDTSLSDRFMVLQSPTTRAILMSIGLMLVIVLLAVILQAVKP